MDQNNISYSMFIDDFNKSINKTHKIRVVEPKTIYHWVEDDAVKNVINVVLILVFFYENIIVETAAEYFVIIVVIILRI